jgi:hypothetical protein
MNKNTLIIAGVVVLGFLFLREKKKQNDAKKRLAIMNDPCYKAYMSAAHPEVVMTAEQKEQYKESWIKECKERGVQKNKQGDFNKVFANMSLSDPCYKAYMSAGHPTVVMTAEQEKVYQENWIKRCKEGYSKKK